MTKKRNGLWTEEEIALLREHYPQGGYKKLVELGIKRTELAVASKAKSLGIAKRLEHTISWSEEEVKLLVKSYREGGLPGALSCGLDKKDSAIKNKVRKIGLCGNENEGVLWNDERLEILHKYYPTEGLQGVRMRGVKESRDIILSKALELGYDVYFG